MFKDSEELEYMKQSAAIADCGHRRALEVLNDGMSELELAVDLGAVLGKNDYEGPLPLGDSMLRCSMGSSHL